MVERYEGLPVTSEIVPAFAFKVSPVKEGALFATAVGIVLIDYVIGDRYIKRHGAFCDSTTINRVDRGVVRWHNRVLGPLSYLMEVAAIVTPAIVTLSDRGIHRELAEDLWVYAETFAVTSALNMTIKTLVQRPIPLLYGGVVLNLEKRASSYRSFYSGHTAQLTNALVANAVMSRLRGKKRVWPWALAAIGTAAVSLARVGCGRHFYTDVAAGAVAGAVVGSLVPLLHPAKSPIEGSTG